MKVSDFKIAMENSLFLFKDQTDITCSNTPGLQRERRSRAEHWCKIMPTNWRVLVLWVPLFLSIYMSCIVIL
jgi:hypothetical protein